MLGGNTTASVRSEHVPAERDREYQTHNITEPLHVLSIAMIGFDYLNYVNSFSAIKQRKN